MLAKVVSDPTVDPSTPDIALGSAKELASFHDRGVAVATEVDRRLPEDIEGRFYS